MPVSLATLLLRGNKERDGGQPCRAAAAMRRNVEPGNDSVQLSVAVLLCLKLEKQPLKRNGGFGRSYKGRNWGDSVWPTFSSSADMGRWGGIKCIYYHKASITNITRVGLSSGTTTKAEV